MTTAAPTDVTASRELLNRTVAELRAKQEELAARGNPLAQQLDKKVSDLTAAVRGLQVALASATQPKYEGSDAYLSDYVEQDAAVLRAGGVVTKELAQHGMGPSHYVRLGTEGDGAVRLRGITYEDGSWDPGLLDDDPQCEWHARLQELVDRRSFVRSMLGQGRRHTPALDRQIARHLRRAPDPIRKIFADSATIGGEWIPDTMMPVLERTLTLARRVEALFQTFSIPSGGSALIPFLTTGLRPYLAGAATADDPAQLSSSSLTTAQRTVTPIKLAVRMQVDRDATEDSLVNFESVGRQEVITALVDGSEDAIINGDTASTHDDTIASWDIRSRWGTAGLGGTGDHRRAWIGLRARAKDVSNTTDQTASQTVTGFETGRVKLDAPHGLGDVVAVTSPEYLLLKMFLFAEVLTVDKFGPQATVVTGQLANLLGVPIVLSEFVGKDLNASGVFDNVTKTKTGLLIFNRSRFKMGLRRGARLEVQADITRDLLNYVATERKVFYTFDSATAKNVHWGYNLDPS